MASSEWGNVPPRSGTISSSLTRSPFVVPGGLPASAIADASVRHGTIAVVPGGEFGAAMWSNQAPSHASGGL